MAAGLTLDPQSPPLLAGRYRLARLIGSGSTSDVYLAYDNEAGRWRAAKVLKFRHLRNERIRSRFKKSGHVMSEVEHPHLLRALNFDVDDRHTPWIITELCEAGTLSDWVDARGVMPAYLAIEVLVQITGALHAAHRMGITARNLRGHRVLIDREGSLKLTSFYRVGVGKALPPDSHDVKQDVVDSATVLYHVLTGRTWSDAAGPDQLYGIPPSLAAIVARATDPDRARSFAGADALARAIEAAMLDIDMPDGPVPALASADSALPKDFDAVFDPAATFPSLEKAVAWRDDPAEADAPPEPGTASDMLRDLARATPGPRATPVVSRRTGHLATPPPAAYSMSRPDGPSAANANQSDVPDKSRYQPSYIVDEPSASRPEEWRQPTPEPADTRDEEPTPRKRTFQWNTELKASVVSLVVLAFLGLGIFLWSGLQAINEAHEATLNAGESLVAMVERHGAVVYAVATRGGDKALLEERFYAVKDATRGAARHRAATAFAEALRAEAGRVGIDPNDPNALRDDATQRVDQVLKAHDALVAATATWAGASRGVRGTIVVGLGLADRPR